MVDDKGGRIRIEDGVDLFEQEGERENLRTVE